MLEYVNIIAFLIFIVTTIFFVYELRSFFKEYKRKKLKLPGFSEKRYEKEKIQTATPLKIQPPKPKRMNYGMVLAGVFGVLTIFVFSVFILRSAQRSSAREKVQPIIKPVKSKGIVIFDANWNQISDEDLKNLKPGDTIFIGIDNPDPADIDKARIRVNEYIWKSSHETENFNKEKNVFYIEYKITSDTARLIIEAQLHSRANGWLVD